MSIVGEGSLGDVVPAALSSVPVAVMFVADIDYYFETSDPLYVTVDGDLWLRALPIDYYFEVTDVLVEQTLTMTLSTVEVLTEIQPDPVPGSQDYEDLEVIQGGLILLDHIEYEYDPAAAEYDYGQGPVVIPPQVEQTHVTVGDTSDVAFEVDDVSVTMTHAVTAATDFDVPTEIDDVSTMAQTHNVVLENPNYYFEIDSVINPIFPGYCQAYESTLVREGQLFVDGFQAAGSTGTGRWASKDVFHFTRVWKGISRGAAEHIENFYDAQGFQEFNFEDPAENPARSYRCVVTEDVSINPMGRGDLWMAKVKFNGYAVDFQALWTREVVAATDSVLSLLPRNVVSTTRSSDPIQPQTIIAINASLNDEASVIISFIPTAEDVGFNPHATTSPFVTSLWREGTVNYGMNIGIANGKIFATMWHNHGTGTGSYLYLEDPTLVKPNLFYTIMFRWTSTGPDASLWVNGGEADNDPGTWADGLTMPAFGGNIGPLANPSYPQWGPPGYKDLFSPAKTYDVVDPTDTPLPTFEGYAYKVYRFTSFVSDADYVSLCQDPTAFPTGTCHYQAEMDEGTGTQIIDSSSTPQNFLMNGATWVSSADQPVMVVVEGADLKWVSRVDITFHGTTEDLTATVTNERCTGTTTSFCVVVRDDLGDQVAREFSWVIYGVREHA